MSPLTRKNRPATAGAARTTWRAFGQGDPSADDRWLQRFQLRIFRLVASISAAGLLALVLRGLVVGGPFPWSDLANAGLFLGILLLLRWRQGWWRPLAWLGLAAFLANAVEGLLPLGVEPIRPALVLIPLLVLYGALLGDLGLSLAAMVGVLGIYAFTWLVHEDLTRNQTFILGNLAVATMATGLGAYGVWIQHQRLVASHRRQADDLRRELDSRLRLNAILFHDLRNPLAVLRGLTDMVRDRPEAGEDDLETIDAMVRRIHEIVDSARRVETTQEIALSPVAVRELWDCLKGLMAVRLAAKEQELVLTEGARLAVRTHREILCNSILGNVLDNAGKFSPRGAEILMSARTEGDEVRIEIRDRGRGFPGEVLEAEARGRRYRSCLGTEGEAGSAYGLHIAALLLRRLGGRLEVRDHEEGGAAVAVVLPAASESAGREDG